MSQSRAKRPRVRRTLGPDARPFFEAAGYDVRPASGDQRCIAVEPFEVGWLYERMRRLWPDEVEPIAALLRAVRLQEDLLDAFAGAWRLGGDEALHALACQTLGISAAKGRTVQELW